MNRNSLILAALMLTGELQPARAGAPNAGPDLTKRAEAVLAIYEQYRGGQFVSIDLEARGRLAAGGIESGKSPIEMLAHYKAIKPFAKKNAPTPIGTAALASAAAVSGSPSNEILTLFFEILPLSPNLTFDDAAELAAAAAISRSSPAEAIAVFNDFNSMFDSERSAILAAGTLRSGADTQALRNHYWNRFNVLSMEAGARLAAGAAISKRPLTEHESLYHAIRRFQTPGPSKMVSAELANAVLAAESNALVKHRLLHPALPAKIGEGTGAEEAFQLNWLGHW